MLTERNFHTETYEVTLGDADYRREMRLSALLRLFQDAAGHHADRLGAGFEDLLSMGITWVLVRIRVEVERMPRLGEKITVETWPREPGSLEFFRDFLVLDAQGNELVRGLSVWTLLDVQERKIRRSSVLADRFPAPCGRMALDVRLTRQKELTHPREAYSRVVGYSDLDLNGHLNNTRYMDLMMDCFSLEEHRLYGVRSVEMAFTSEVLPGETLEMSADVSRAGQGTVRLEGRRREAGKTAFRAEVTIVERSDPEK
jgi:acyl-ACP thioesterase